MLASAGLGCVPWFYGTVPPLPSSQTQYFDPQPVAREYSGTLEVKAEQTVVPVLMGTTITRWKWPV